VFPKSIDDRAAMPATVINPNTGHSICFEVVKPSQRYDRTWRSCTGTSQKQPYATLPSLGASSFVKLFCGDDTLYNQTARYGPDDHLSSRLADCRLQRRHFRARWSPTVIFVAICRCAMRHTTGIGSSRCLVFDHLSSSP
jgi:hypothetical protein